MDLLRIYIDEEQSVRVIVISVLKRQELLGDGKCQPVERSLHTAVREHCDCFVMGTQGAVSVFFVFGRQLPKTLIVPVLAFRCEYKLGEIAAGELSGDGAVEF